MFGWRCGVFVVLRVGVCCGTWLLLVFVFRLVLLWCGVCIVVWCLCLGCGDSFVGYYVWLVGCYG